MPKQPKRNKNEWMQLFDAQQQSGMTIRAFCESQSLNYQTFMARKSDLKRKRASHRVTTSRSASTQLVKVDVPKRNAAVAAVTVKHGESELHIHDSQDVSYLASLIKALNA